MRRWLGLLVVAILAASCGDDGGGDDGGAAVPEPEVEMPRIDLAAEPTPGSRSSRTASPSKAMASTW
ncbi:MAG: hypothetical protein P8J50_05740 [Acidimicrobiales bacterium]|jgi:hypothetical protein|nr:hypothetical protein [Acidimicrobiales bacterium]